MPWCFLLLHWFFSARSPTDAGLDPDKPPATWREWLDAGKKLTKPGGDRWGINFPGTYDYCGWLTSAFVMQNGGQYYNHDYGGEVYYNAPSTLGALALLDTLVNRAKVMPPGVSDANACTSAFFCRPARHDVAVDGSLSFVRDNMKSPYKVAFLPKNVRSAAPIGALR